MTVTEEIFETLKLLTPWDIDAPKTRLGHDRDGGYILADLLNISSDVISVGIAGETSFDSDMSRLGKRIHQYDHTIKSPPDSIPNTTFHRLGIGPTDDPESNLVSLKTIVEEKNFSKNQAILKMDIESAEWGVLPAIDNSVFDTFSQITMEIHRLERMHLDDHRERVFKSLTNLNEKYTLFHVHANNYSKLTRCDSFVVPECLEVSYVKTDLVQRAPSQTFYPSAIDRPNNPKAPEYYLWMFPFFPSSVPESTFRRELRRNARYDQR